MDADYPLTANYTIFGHVTAGQDVVHAIATVPVVSTDPTNPKANRPVEPVTFSVKVIK
jgi:cyclophilin family peptidyl-prolyl cis-trans isomerase